MSNCRRPQVGQAISTGPRSRSLSALRISQATLTSSSAWNVDSEIRIVSPIPSASSVPRPTADFSDPRPLRAGLGHAEMQRVRDLLGQQPVRRDRVRDARRLHRDLEVGELEPLHQLDELDRGRDQRLDRVRRTRARAGGSGSEPELTPIRSGVPSSLARPLHDLGDLVGAADVARVQPHAVGAGVERLQRQRVVEVDVGDHRDRRLADDRLAAPRRPCRAAPRQRTMSAPASATRRICAIVAARSAVSVLVIVWTATGASPPTRTPPTSICRSEAMLRSVEAGGARLRCWSATGGPQLQPLDLVPFR